MHLGTDATVSVLEAARTAGVHPASVARAVDDGRLAGSGFGRERRILLDGPNGLRDWISRRVEGRSSTLPTADPTGLPRRWRCTKCGTFGDGLSCWCGGHKWELAATPYVLLVVQELTLLDDRDSGGDPAISTGVSPVSSQAAESPSPSPSLSAAPPLPVESGQLA